MPRREVLDYVRAQLATLETAEEAQADAERTVEEVQRYALGARLPGVINNSNKSRDVRATARAAMELLETHFD